MRREIRICGFGGQGIILAGVILGDAASRAGLAAVQTQSYGPESRGGAARAEVVVSTDPIDYPRVERADVLVALSKEAYDRYRGELADDGLVVVDADLVDADDGSLALPFTKIAERVGHAIVTNMVVLGYLNARLGLVPNELLEERVAANVPPGTEELNLAAVRAGRQAAEGERG